MKLLKKIIENIKDEKKFYYFLSIPIVGLILILFGEITDDILMMKIGLSCFIVLFIMLGLWI